MQVSHVQDHCTHAVIGGKQSIEFGISNSAEFFNILSSTLYKDQILAVVREVLCNAWDAHIEAGCTDRPVLITLERDKLIIKDLGKGIHHDDMGLIYGTYGNSTKKNDGQQTGGFGLGCKAPFAYTDHFEVISCHAGVKTIYNLSKSSAQAMGKPGITPIASFPTTDTGLTVTIRIKPSDHARFATLIQRIVHNGDMNMLLNTKQLDTVGFDLSKGNYLLTQTTLLDTQRCPILVRYGNVVYPVDSVKAIEEQYNAIYAHLETLYRPSFSPGYCIIFQAPAHSISVTPSRESLSMQEHTVETLKTLFTGFLTLLDTEYVVACDQYAEEITHKAVAEQRIDQLLMREEALPDLHEAATTTNISDLATMARAYLRKNYPAGLDYRKADITRRLESMVQEKLLDRGQVQTFLKAMKETNRECYQNRGWRTTYESNSWLQRRVLAPLLIKLSQSGLATDALYVCNSEDCNWLGKSGDTTPPLVPATCARPHNHLATLPYLRNIVVLASRRADLVSRSYLHAVFKTAGRYHGFLVYIVGRKKGDAEAARQFFANQGMRVADLTLADAQAVKVSRAPSVPRKPVKKGLPCLSTILYEDRVYVPYAHKEGGERIETPEFVINIPNRRNTSNARLDGWKASTSFSLVKLFGDKGGVTTTDRMHAAWIAKGAKESNEYIREKVCAYILNNPRIEEYWAFCSDHLISGVREQSTLIDVIYSNSVLMKEFGLVSHLTAEDKLYLHIWKELEDRYYFPEISVVKDWLKAIPAAPVIKVLSDKLNNPLINLLSVGNLQNGLRHKDQSYQDKAIQLLITIINS